jgi:glycosyltransferase involved in cell wall biosynthesis
LNAVRTAEALVQHGVELSVTCLSGEGPLLDRYTSVGIPVALFGLRGLATARAIRAGVEFTRHIRSAGVHIVHAHDLYSNMFAAPCAKAACCPLLTSRRWLHGPSRLTYRLANRLAYRCSDRVVANAPALARHLVDVEHLSSERVVTVNNFVGEDAFQPPPAGWCEDLKARLGVPEGSVTVCVVASLRPVKDHATLLKAAARIAQKHPTFYVVLVGADYGCRAALEEIIDASDMRGRVLFSGLLASRPSPHYAFDVAALSSVSEGFPNSLLEAMAAGRPVVATRVGGIPDVVVHEETGVLVEPSSVPELADALDHLLADRCARIAMGAKGRARALHEYSLKHTMDRLLQVYRETVEIDRKTGC